MINIALTSFIFSGLKSAAVLGLVYFLFRIGRLWTYYVRLFHYGNKFPGPKTIPIFGNALQINGSLTEMFSNVVDLMFEYKSNFRVWLGWQLFICVNNPEDAQIVLNGALSKSSLYDLFIAQKGSLFAPIAIWKKHRKLLTPAFHTKVLETFMEVFTTQTNTLVTKLNAKVGGPEFVIYDFLIRCTLDNIFETSLGSKLETEEDKKIYDAWPRLFKASTKRIFNILLRPECIFLRTQTGTEYTKSKDLINGFTEMVLKEKKVESSIKAKQNRSHEFDIRNHQNETSIRKRLPLIELLLDAEQLSVSKEEIMSDEEMRDEMVVIMIAGSDTLAMAMSSVLVLLGMHPQIQDKAYSEIHDIFGNSNRLPHLDDLKKMPYLERVLKESMRLFPVNVVIPRAADEDIVLSDKSIIPRGATGVVAMWKLHRDPEVWPDPTRFDPDRFLPEEVAKRHPYSYIPFSAGPRNCIGMKYAWMSLYVMLSTILRRYRVICDHRMEDIKMEMNFIIMPENEHRLRLVRRTQNSLRFQ